MATYIKHTPRGALLAIFTDIKNSNCFEMTITNPKRTFVTSKRLANKATSVVFQEHCKRFGWKAQGK